ncbi:MAG TPA: thiamine pyrophosphate-binding protein [Thermoleophilaceae bacterium]|nr:thiamine pyrophosphate-binding protein [Thermoleophilaceae bacterium]
MTVTGAELLVGGLESAGVEVCFGLPGVHNLAAWKALAASDIRLVGARHEQTAVYAADGYARASGRVGVAITTTGPGAANTLGALGEAWASGSPVVVIATDIPSSIRRPGVHRGALHEASDQAAMFRPVTKAVLQAAAPGELRALIHEALALATEPPSRPVYVEVPTDLLPAAAEEASPDASLPELPVPDSDELHRAVAILSSAKRPLVWAGGGALRSGAGEAVAAVAERLAAPVFTTNMARGLIGADHPCAIGLPPHLPAAGRLWDEADAVLAIGTDFDGMMTQNWAMPPPRHLVAINVDPADAAKNYEPELVLVGDAARVTAELADQLPSRDGVADLQKRLDGLRAGAFAELEREHPDEMRFLAAFREAVPADAVVVADMCIPGYWLGALHPVSGPRRLAYPMGWGTLGYGFPLSIGSALADTGPAVCVCGDGGFLYACGELATVAQERIPLTVVIVDDGGYGMLRFDQRHSGDPTFGVDLLTPDFEAMARSFGIEGESVDGLGDEFSRALARQIAADAPTVLVARAALEPPPTTSPRWYRRTT